jgi:HK97 family phage prohead protease
MIRFTSNTFAVEAAGPDGENRRTITGIAVPYNTFATVSDGTTVQFMPGSLPVEGKAPKLYMNHDSTQAIGLVAERVDSEEAMYFTAKVSNTRAGDEALVLAADGVIDSVSVGVNPTEFKYDDKGNMTILSADWVELSLVPTPAFAGATISQVAASEPVAEEPKEEPKMETTPAVVEEVVVPTAPIFAQPKRNFGMPTAGEYLAAYHIGGEVWNRVNAAAVEVMKSRQTALQAAAGDSVTTDSAGLLNVNVLGPVFEDLNYIRPVVTAVGARAMPDGGNQKTWIRPTWTTHTDVGAQSSELAAVAARTPVIASNVISKTTLAGQVTFSVQDIDFTSPGALEIVLRDLAGQYMIQSDALLCNAILAGDTASGSTWTVTAEDPTSLIAALYDAATDILQATNFLPDHIFVSTDVWKKLGSQLDADKRPIFPYTGAAGLMGVNGMGTANVTQMNTFNPLGLNLVVDRAFSENTMVVARGSAIEFYEQIRGIMTRDEPGNLGKVFSYHGYASTFIADGDQVKSIAIA